MLHQVGAGALGPVFRAYDPDRDRLVAVKLFRLDLPPERVHRLVAEFEKLIAAVLTHPSIAAPVEAGIVGANAYLVQDYVTADSLDITLRDEGPAPPGDALRVAAQIAAGLDFAAVAGVSHGALHPRDVMLSTDGTWVTGLGVAHAVEHVGGGVTMRRPYTAPERTAGAAWDRRSDIFSLAALIHEMLWGRRITATGDRAADALTDLPDGDLDRLRAVFACALADDPAGRFETALEFVQALKHAFPSVALAPAASRTGERSERFAADESLLTMEEPELPSKQSADLDLFALDTAVEPAEGPVELGALPVDTGADVAPPAFASVPAEEPAPAQETGALAAFAYEQSRSAVWPLVLAVVVGVALGFAGGYGVGVHDRPAATQPVAFAAEPAGREFTEGAVSDPAGRQANAQLSTPSSTPVNTPSSPRQGEALKAAPVAAAVEHPRAPLESAASLLVRTTPAGAQVFVDGRDYGRAPVSVRDLARGTHRLRVERTGFATNERRIVVSASREPQTVVVALSPNPPPKATRAVPEAPKAVPPRIVETARPVPAPAATAPANAGPLSVESRPAGASVFVDNRLVGTTPLSIAQVPAGEHTVRLELAGYRHWSSSTRVTAGEPGRITASLEK